MESSSDLRAHIFTAWIRRNRIFEGKEVVDNSFCPLEIKYDDLIEGYADEVSLVSDVFDNLFGAPMKCISKQQAPQVSGGTYQINIYFQLLKAKLEIYYGRSVCRRTLNGHYRVSYGYIDKTRQPSIGSRLSGAICYLMENA